MIKTYADINPEDGNLTFELKRMEAIYEKADGRPDAPHRHGYYTIILVESGEGRHIVDFNEFALAGSQVYFITPGQVHQLVAKRQPVGSVIAFSPGFLLQNGIDDCFITDINLFNAYGFSPPLEVTPVQMEELTALAAKMAGYQRSADRFSYQAIGACLKLFLIICNNACTLVREENTQTVQAGISILRNFKQLVEENFQSRHQVGFYARRLAVTAGHLNNTVKALTGKTAKEFIQERIATEARRLLFFSDLNTKQIGFELGFSDPAYFSNFFKKMTGQSAQAFKTASHP
ncbi:MAG: helix-turn-helix domain-containing protein [Lewinella sp.]|nr:helix-turn-helix domain-containing protein [Lewinella sp.]